MPAPSSAFRLRVDWTDRIGARSFPDERHRFALTSVEPRRAVLVEDDPSFLGLVETILAERGYHVFTSADGIDAWPLIRVHRPHLLILDLNLPGIGGLELLMRLRGHPDTAATPVLVCSGAVADLRALESRLRQLHCAVLAKPFELDELERTLQQLVPDFPAPQP